MTDVRAGTEPLSFYLINLFLNFNIAIVALAVLLPVSVRLCNLTTNTGFDYLRRMQLLLLIAQPEPASALLRASCLSAAVVESFSCSIDSTIRSPNADLGRHLLHSSPQRRAVSIESF